MSTAVVVVHLAGREPAQRVAQTLGAPFVLTPNSEGFYLSVAKPDELEFWETVSLESVEEVQQWLRPEAARQVKAGLRQLPLFDFPVDFLARAKAKGSEQLGPIVGEALFSAVEALSSEHKTASKGPARAHQEAARLVIGALTALVIRDADPLEGDEDLKGPPPAGEVVSKAAVKHPETFGWLRSASPAELRVLNDLTDQLGQGIDYRSMDPAILSLVYEQALVDDEDRRELGIHYTPPELAARMLDNLPVEFIDPQHRHVLDPACGSGSLLVAAHERLHKLQPQDWSVAKRHQDLKVHLRGQDIDPFATGIAQLALLLKAQPAGNGWAIETVDTLSTGNVQPRPRIIVMNPPWMFTSKSDRSQRADDFIGWAADELVPGGLLGAILPTSWLSADNSKQTRERICSEFEVFEIWRLPESTFSQSNQAPSVILARKREAGTDEGKRVVRHIRRQELKPFLVGHPPQVNAVVGDLSAELSRAMPTPTFANEVCPLEEIAIIRSGQQRYRKNPYRDEGVRYLRSIRDVAPYGGVDVGKLKFAHFPEDFAGTRGKDVINKRKVLVPAMKNPGNPWRFKVALDLIGVSCTNNIRCIAPIDQSDDDILYAILAIFGSGFASAYAARAGIDRHITAPVMRTFPVPQSRTSIRHLGRLGYRAFRNANDLPALASILDEIEEAVWNAYGPDEYFQAQAVRLLSGHVAPEQNVRYPGSDSAPFQGKSTMRRVGAVLDTEQERLRIWISGITPDHGYLMDLPPRLPGWLVRPGATFDASGIDTMQDITNASFEFQPMSWKLLDLDDPPPEHQQS
ncbi:MAG: SAM-dependent methyltransferase [Acidimicrobiia bacterium]|nr:SAM-dependent methyltransferase [Acidimicrobiia bacterium]